MSVPFVSRLKFVVVCVAISALGLSVAACDEQVDNRSQVANRVSDRSVDSSESSIIDDGSGLDVYEPEVPSEFDSSGADLPPKSVPFEDNVFDELSDSGLEPLFNEEECITEQDYYFIDRQEYLYLDGQKRYINQDDFIDLFSQYDGLCLHQAVGSSAPGADFPLGEMVYVLCGEHEAAVSNRTTLGKLSRVAQAYNPDNYFTGIECNNGTTEEAIRDNQYLIEGGPETE